MSVGQKKLIFFNIYLVGRSKYSTKKKLIENNALEIK